MKIAVISDIHDNIVNLAKCLRWCEENRIVGIICCGDVVNAETLACLAGNFSVKSEAPDGRTENVAGGGRNFGNERKNSVAGKIYLVRGNMELYDWEETAKYGNINYLGRLGAAIIAGKKAGVCHEPEYINEVLRRNPDCDIIFYGHTHKPWLEKRGGITAVNPGTLGGVFQKPTFAVWEPESGGLELKLLEDLR